MRNSYAHLLIISLLLTLCLAESYSALTAFGSSSTQNQNQNVDKHGSRRTRECKSDEECAAIQNTTCMSDPRDYKMRCLCRDSSAPINGACPNRPRGIRVITKPERTCSEVPQNWNFMVLRWPKRKKKRILCRPLAETILCSAWPTVGSPCKMDIECIEGSECKSMNITVTSFKTCQCKDGFMSRDGYCTSAVQIAVPSFFTVLVGALGVLLLNKANKAI